MKALWLAKLLRRIIKTDRKRKPDFKIGDPNDPYMLRWFVIPRNRWFNIYLHQMRKDDDDRALHDHPFASLSIMLEGNMGEFYARSDGARIREDLLFRHVSAGAIIYRNGRFAHRLVVPGRYAKTLFITGPRFRKWGFYCPHSWRYWEDFVQTNARGEIGRGCD